MERITNGHQLSKSQDLVKENIEILKELFPTIVRENQIVWDELRAVLGEEVISDEEYYNFTWAGKSQSKIETNKLSTGTLRPCKEESKSWQKTQNIFIEGDNLEVLKLLQKPYASKIKMMYFDPPYNTGKDFVYKDNYDDNLANYLIISGQADETGKKIRANTESEGRFHSNWLNMMYPRLKLARNLLSEEGVIFISIDDNEIQNLKKLCDEIFGEVNFVCQFTREAIKGGSVSKFVRRTHDFILTYAKKIENLGLAGFEKDEIELNLEDERGPYAKGRELNKWGAGSRRIDSPSMWFPIKGPNDVDVYPIRNDGSEGRWRLGRKKMKELIENDDVIFELRQNGTYIAYEKLRGNKSSYTQFITILKDKYLNAFATEELKSLFQRERGIFDFSKPSILIQDLIVLADLKDDDIVLDIFAGSGTTGSATMVQNSEDGVRRKFILIQLPEPTEENSEANKEGYKTIPDLAKDRINLAGNRILDENRKNLEDLKKSIEGKILQDETEAEIKELENIIENLDTGFRVFKLDTSNILAWDGSVENLEENLLSAIENIKSDRKEEDVLFEILLKYGIDLAQPVEEKEIAGCKAFNIGAGVLFVCLSDKITTAVADGIGAWKNELNPAVSKVVFKDSGFAGDVDKTNAIQILKRFGITDVKSI